jgi:hypothetical protein
MKHRNKSFIFAGALIALACLISCSIAAPFPLIIEKPEAPIVIEEPEFM